MDAAADTANGGMAMEEGAWSEPGSFHATVEILDMDVSMDSGILYTAKILSSDQPGIEMIPILLTIVFFFIRVYPPFLDHVRIYHPQT